MAGVWRQRLACGWRGRVMKKVMAKIESGMAAWHGESAASAGALRVALAVSDLQRWQNGIETQCGANGGINGELCEK